VVIQASQISSRTLSKRGKVDEDYLDAAIGAEGIAMANRQPQQLHANKEYKRRKLIIKIK
jgi:hypothetical protein